MRSPRRGRKGKRVSYTGGSGCNPDGATEAGSFRNYVAESQKEDFPPFTQFW